MKWRNMINVKEYILLRVSELDKLISEQDPSSNHYYALMAGKYELLNLATKLENNNE